MKDIRARKNVKKGLLASKKDRLHKISTKGKKRGAQNDGKQGRRRAPVRQTQIKSKKVKQIVKKEKPKKKKEEDETMLDHFPSDEYMNFKDQVEITKEDEKILEQFQINLSAFEEKQDEFTDNLQEIIEENLETKKQADIKENILNDPQVRLVYQDIAKIMKEYTSGKIAKPFKAIPLLDQWEKIIELTKPQEWSPHAMFAATRMFASSFDQFRARVFYEKYLLPAVRENIKHNKKLNYHYYQALIKAFYKPAAWFKGILFPLCKSQTCSIKEAQIFGSVLSKLSIPVTHSSVAIVKIVEMGFTGPTAIFIKTLLEKKYALPTRVVNCLVSFFVKYENSDLAFPVIFYQLVLRVCELYSSTMDEMQKTSIKSLVKKKKHEVLTPLIISALDNLSKTEIAEKNIEKSKIANKTSEKMALE